MLKVISCLTVQHDFRFILVAAVVCLFASMTAFWLHARAVSPKGLPRRYWLALTGMACGAGIWATHFIAMLAYQPGFTTGYMPLGTFGSLLIAMGVAGVGFAIATAPRLRPSQRLALSGPALGCGIAAMHYFGMASFRTQGTVAWDIPYVVVSIVLGVALATTALMVAGDGSRIRRRLSAGVLLTLAICSLHFTGMAAVTITPDPTVVVPVSVLSSGVMAAVVAILALLLIAGAAWTVSIDASSRRGALNTLRTAIDAMPDGMAFFDPRGRCLVWNRRYAELAPPGTELEDGFTLEDLLRGGLAQGWYAAAVGREEQWLAERLAVSAAPRGPIEHHLTDGSWLRVEERRMPDGSTVTVCVDITELKSQAEAMAEARRLAEDANRAKSEFLANMSHEIRTPLNGVIAVAETLCRQDLKPAQHDMVELIRDSGQILARLLSDILDLAKVESGQLSIETAPYQLGDMVRAAGTLAEFAAADKGLSFNLRIDPDVDRTVLGDQARTRQIVTNLLSNAVKFTTKGEVALAMFAAEPGRVRIEVTDTGVGFETADRDRIFGRFQQADGSIGRRFGGAGLGLSISRNLAELMDGVLECEGRPGEGATFWIDLPLVASAPADAPETADQASIERPLRVLLADDHPTNRKVVQLLLSDSEVELTEVEDGAQAVAAFGAERFDAILMDMQMPVMDGLTAVRHIRDLEAKSGGAPTPIIMLTANALPEHIHEARLAGADLHLAKPVSAAGLFGALNEVLSSAEPDLDVAAA